MDSVLDAIAKRASVRSFTPEPVTPAEWDALMRAAMAAPSAVNSQPWDFVIIEDRKTLDALADALPYAKMAREAPGAVVLCGSAARAFGGKEAFAVIDASLAGENLLVAATALGLGAVWTALYPEEARMAATRSVLGVPRDVIPLAFIPVGHPKGPAVPKDKYRTELIHRERW